MLLYLARHAQTASSAVDSFNGRRELALTERGREQARKLGERLRGIEWAAVYRSPLGRTLETAALVAPGRERLRCPASSRSTTASGKDSPRRKRGRATRRATMRGWRTLPRSLLRAARPRQRWPSARSRRSSRSARATRARPTPSSPSRTRRPCASSARRWPARPFPGSPALVAGRVRAEPRRAPRRQGSLPPPLERHLPPGPGPRHHHPRRKINGDTLLNSSLGSGQGTA